MSPPAGSGVALRAWGPLGMIFSLWFSPQKTFTPNIISRKIKEEPREDVAVKKEKKERERQRDGHGRGRNRPEVIQSHSIFEQGPAEMMKKKGVALVPPRGAECALCHCSGAECPLCHHGIAECPLYHWGDAECPLCHQEVLSVPYVTGRC
uniref:RNA polymerase III subunit D n=1 Tax=Serinus canaria TaxID=9135 RepID=A0A8C9KSU8_SERCA